MNNRELAIEFVRCFCAGDVSGLASILAEDLQFRGPFHHFGSNQAYLDSLEAEPPEKCGYRVLSITENGDSVSVYYDYEKSDRTITVAQLFTIADQRIGQILLVFDGRGFA